MLLDVEQPEYVFYSLNYTNEAGFYVSIGEPGTINLSPGTNAYLASAGSTTRIALKKERVCSILYICIYIYTYIYMKGI